VRLPWGGEINKLLRTIPEMEKVMEELRKLTEYWKSQTAEGLGLVGLMLSSRKNLCLHPEVRGERDGKVVDSRCHALTAPHVRERHNTQPEVPVCSLYEGFDAGGRDLVVPPGVYNLEDLRGYCGARGWCPYFFTRWAIGKAQVVVYSYHYLLDPKIAEVVSKDMARNSVIVFDEAHNIDNTCIDSMSVKINRRLVDRCLESVTVLETEMARLKDENSAQLQGEYQALVAGLRLAQERREADQVTFRRDPCGQP
jgi:DNA excision repair protein ERCC-2